MRHPGGFRAHHVRFRLRPVHGGRVLTTAAAQVRDLKTADRHPRNLRRVHARLRPEQAYLKKRAASGEAPSPAPASSAAKTGSERKKRPSPPRGGSKAARRFRSGFRPGGSGLEHARIAHPPPATLVACEASKARGGDAGPAARRAPASARDAAPGTPPRAEPPRARVEQSRTPSRTLSSRNGERERVFGGTETKEKGGWVVRSPRSNKVAPRPATPVLSLRESWNRLALRDGLRRRRVTGPTR